MSDNEERQHLEELKHGHQRRLRVLELQAATFGALTPPAIVIEIEDIRGALAQLDSTLNQQSTPAGLDVPYMARRSRHHLPAQTTTMVGREREIAQISALLRQPDVRLVTLTGPGGTGKTRLSIQVASELADNFPDGVSFVALAAITETTLVGSVIAQALGIRETGARSPAEDLKAFLRDQKMLLVLDNFEQVIDGAPLIGELLAAAPNVKILVTSRVVLRVYGEHEFTVPPLALPDPRRLPSLEQLTQYEAVRLFIDRALLVKPKFSLTNENAQAITEICVRLDGLPLAIELVAARIKLLSPHRLREKLVSRLQAAVGGARDLPERQQTLRGALDWSYHLLGEGEQRLFARLAVFAGGCTLESAETVCNADSDLGLDVLDGIDSLVSKSLLRQGAEMEGEPRFEMLETIREYAFERLGNTGEETTIRNRHLAFFRKFMEVVNSQSQGQLAWQDRLEVEHDNLRAALNWSKLATADQVTDLELAIALAPFWLTRGYYSEGQRWLEDALEKDKEAPALLRARALFQTGKMARNQSDYERARTHFEASLALYREVDNQRGAASVLESLGWIDYFEGDTVKAASRFEESLTICRALDARHGIASSLRSLGRIKRTEGDYAAAQALYEESLAIFRQMGNEGGIANGLSELGDLMRLLGDYDSARTFYKESMAIHHKSGSRKFLAGLLGRLGRIAVDQQEWKQANELMQESLAIYREIGDKAGAAWILGIIGWAVEEQGDDLTAQEFHQQSLELYQEVGEKPAIANQFRALGNVASNQRAFESAHSYYQQSLRLWREIRDQRSVAEMLHQLGRLALREHKDAKAVSLCEESLAICKATGDKRNVGWILATLGRSLTRQAEFGRAHMLFEESLIIQHELNRPAGIADTLEGFAELALALSDPTRAAHLFAAAAAFREFKGVPVPHTERAEYTAAVASVRTALGESAFEITWADGERLTLDQAIEEALRSE
jgi:predicted ATPase